MSTIGPLTAAPPTSATMTVPKAIAIAATAIEGLPEPQPGIGGNGEALTAIHEANSFLANAQSDQAKSAVHQKTNDKEIAVRRQREAEAAARKAREDGGIFGFLPKEVVLVAVAAATVASAGAAGVGFAVAAAASQVAAYAIEKTQVFGDASKWVALGVSVAGSGAGAANSLLGGSAAFGEGLRTAAVATQGVAAGVSGTEAIQTAHNERNAAEEEIEVVDAFAQKRSLERQIEGVIESFEEARSALQRANGVIQETIQQHTQTAVIASSAIGTVKG